MLSSLNMFFPFKDIVTEKANTTSNVFQDLTHINFFDNEYLKILYDDERVNPSLNSYYRSQSDSSHSFVHGEGVNIDGFLSGNNRNDAQSSDDTFAAQNEHVTTLKDNVVSKGNLDQNPSTSTQGQFVYFSLKSHLKTAFKILRYLNGSTRLGIHVPKSSDILTKGLDIMHHKVLVKRIGMFDIHQAKIKEDVEI
nr:hypothetical protein [Tanacetum cinerariifolium]